ncbi:hypothetical protein ACFORH_38995 [Amycolatopsis roodepoortensis]|uniref:Site-specific recombinase XerD n=1 Tax=Amycolatopsis roodepoortensis TaxID=700274 RepID=A0ABR9LIY4_9PSEU|nr:integrase [Amycolatopsis roodepoortensis]MBE1580502.1 site-specific recombinase XerD [Amycolatopsis roodepoortensis]
MSVDDALADPALPAQHRAALAGLAERAAGAGWPPVTVGRAVAELHHVLTTPETGAAVALSRVRAALPSSAEWPVVAAVLAEHDVLREDTVPTMHAWIDRKTADLPDGFRDPVRAWLRELNDGGPRTKPRARSTLYAYFGRTHPHLQTWSRTYEHLREVTEADVRAVLDAQRGHERAGTFTSLRSLFAFARRARVSFADPARKVHVGRAPKRQTVPLDEAEAATIRQAAVSPLQRLVVGLVAVYAVRATAVRTLTLDDLDFRWKRIRIAGAARPMPDLVHRLLRNWLVQRRRKWPHTGNRHVLLSRVSAAGSGPVSDYYLSWHLAMRDIPLERLRADRILSEALAVDADPLHLAAAFGLSMQTAIDYSEIARTLASRPIEQPDAPSTPDR